MKTVPGQLRAKALKGAPCLAMSATSTKSEIDELRINLGFREANTVVLKASPIQSHFNYVKLRRPANIYGSYGLEENDKPGLIQLLDRIYLDEYVESIKNGKKLKKAIFFFRREDDIPDVYDYICERLPAQAANPDTIPWVQNHSGIGPVTAESIRQRRDSISLYLSTSVMLLGLDFEDIEIVVMIRPFNFCHYLVQAAGRGGRKMENGLRRRVLFYLLYNNSDISKNVPGLSQAVRSFCQASSCLKEYLRKYFDSDAECQPNLDWCCSSCLGIES